MKRFQVLRVWRVVLCVCSLALAVLLSSCQRSAAVDQAASAGGDTSSEGPKRVFNSPLAGRWYEGDKQKLVEEIDKYLARVTDKPIPNICALILPHAGYRWSGPTAAYGLHHVKGTKPKRVIVIGPSHRVRMENVASVPGYTHYSTPLGEVPLDRPFIDQLRKHPEFRNVPHAHDGEHSVQIELPLLQHVLGEFQFVPVVVGQLDRPATKKIARILRGLIDSDTLVVASSDFTHYGLAHRYVPFTENIPKRLKQLDGGAMEFVCKKDLNGLFDYIDETGATICGRCAIGVLLEMLPEDATLHNLKYDTSGEMLDDYSNSVSYYAVAVSGKWADAPPVQPPETVGGLSEFDRAQLLKLARASLTYALKNRRYPTAEQLGLEISEPMERISGAFVTLQKNGQLRGCIGEIFPSRPLFKCVIENAVNAGINDHRFSRVSLSELEDIHFEISVLTPPEAVSSSSDIVIGKHGVVFKKAGRSAVFLPQIAVEQGWDLETTLTQLSLKAGLRGDAWRDRASFDVFEAIVFEEEKDTTESAIH